ncbi:MAG TPA: glycosyltransferase, partial [Candidatus Didemnitutus sp.]|nr:glycosyltransferase [Candidatus Didemnitutus sp.]
SLRERVQAAGLTEFVHFAGELTLARYRDWFNAAYLTLMPTHHHEGMPRTLIDSQAMHVPPLVYDIGGTPDGVRHNQTGFLLKLGDVAAMTESAATLLANPAQRHEMAAKGRAFVEAEFSMDAFLARHEQFYLETVARHRQKNR